MRRAVAFAGLVVIIWSIQDIVVWQRFFEARGLWQFNDQYQFWHQAFLILLIAVGASQLRGRSVLLVVAATWTLAYGGLADVLYYLLDLKPIPTTLPWLDHGWNQFVLLHPVTTTNLLLSTLAWMGLWVAASLAIPATKRLAAS
jgi:hypothetical protein